MRRVTIKLTKTNIDDSVCAIDWQCDRKLFDESATICGGNFGSCAQSVECDLLVSPDWNLRRWIFFEYGSCATNIMKVRVQHRNNWSRCHGTQLFDGRTHFLNRFTGVNCNDPVWRFYKSLVG